MSLDGQEAVAQSLAGLAALIGAADGRLRYGMVEEALGSKEGTATGGARESGRSSGSGKVNAIGLVATLAFPAGTQVVPQVITVEALFAFQTVIGFPKKFGQGMAYIVVFSDFDETQQFVVGLVGAFEDDLVAMVGGHDHDLVISQDYLK